MNVVISEWGVEPADRRTTSIFEWSNSCYFTTEILRFNKAKIFIGNSGDKRLSGTEIDIN